MTNYRRYYLKGGCYFFTVVLANRHSSLLTEHITGLRGAFREVMTKHPFNIDAMVVLPNHLHCIWTLPPGEDNFSMRWRQIKTVFSKGLPPIEVRSASQIKQGERGIWQRRFWEHAISHEEDYRRHVDYIHYNPVKHGYVPHVADWPYSSFHRFVREGIYAANWTNDCHEGMDLE